MLTEADRTTLAEAGITNIDRLASAAAAFLRAHPIYEVPPVTNALSETEESFLRDAGARGVGAWSDDSAADNVAVIAGEFAQMVTTALSQKEVAELLGVSTSRIRQKLEAGELYAVRTTGGRVCPRFQFGPGGTLPGLESVLRALRPEAHPVAVQRFFMEVHPDLESEALNRALSPHEWLLTGHSPETLVVLASEV
ncbi:MAG: excisionase family DNA-binding protein [Halieaceae bacterium]|jgi:excisionase family DNA binding protein|nr:excisionase family DNA-binding protein [Halieaceae bacterium]